MLISALCWCWRFNCHLVLYHPKDDESFWVQHVTFCGCKFSFQAGIGQHFNNMLWSHEYLRLWRFNSFKIKWKNNIFTTGAKCCSFHVQNLMHRATCLIMWFVLLPAEQSVVDSLDLTMNTLFFVSFSVTLELHHTELRRSCLIQNVCFKGSLRH